uniref:Uncharacterized protein n=1 Tax=Clavispora lusitaniae TaxID=36911 RepID=S5U4L8_CLALS|nr:hypothetical protein [Clavispora lusitaniae]AGS44303.1 hypothetical protein [Clavispora lusitaniae]
MTSLQWRIYLSNFIRVDIYIYIHLSRKDGSPPFGGLSSLPFGKDGSPPPGAFIFQGKMDLPPEGHFILSIRIRRVYIIKFIYIKYFYRNRYISNKKYKSK